MPPNIALLLIIIMYSFFLAKFFVASLNIDEQEKLLLRFCMAQKLVIFTTKSVEYMPFYLSLATFVNGVVWTAYALIRFDPIIIVIFLKTSDLISYLSS